MWNFNLGNWAISFSGSGFHSEYLKDQIFGKPQIDSRICVQLGALAHRERWSIFETKRYYKFLPHVLACKMSPNNSNGKWLGSWVNYYISDKWRWEFRTG